MPAGRIGFVLHTPMARSLPIGREGEDQRSLAYVCHGEEPSDVAISTRRIGLGLYTDLRSADHRQVLRICCSLFPIHESDYRSIVAYISYEYLDWPSSEFRTNRDFFLDTEEHG
jgi:hypothetical protein